MELTKEQKLELQLEKAIVIADHFATNLLCYGNEKNGKGWFESVMKEKISELESLSETIGHQLYFKKICNSK